MRWPRCTGTLVATSLAAVLGTWDALAWDATREGAHGSGGLVAAMCVAPALVAEIALDARVRERPLAAARLRVAIVGITAVALGLAWLRAPMLARFADRALAGWLWAALAVVLVATGVAIGEPLARRLATRTVILPRAVVVALAVVLALWIAWSLVAAPPVRGLAAELRV